MAQVIAKVRLGQLLLDWVFAVIQWCTIGLLLYLYLFFVFIFQYLCFKADPHTG